MRLLGDAVAVPETALYSLPLCARHWLDNANALTAKCLFQFGVGMSVQMSKDMNCPTEHLQIASRNECCCKSFDGRICDEDLQQ